MRHVVSHDDGFKLVEFEEGEGGAAGEVAPDLGAGRREGVDIDLVADRAGALERVGCEHVIGARRMVIMCDHLTATGDGNT